MWGWNCVIILKEINIILFTGLTEPLNATEWNVYFLKSVTKHIKSVVQSSVYFKNNQFNIIWCFLWT